MNASELKKVLQGAVMGNHRELESILELYMPMIEHNSYLYGRLDEDLRRMPASGYLKPAFFEIFCRRVYGTKKLSVFTCVRHPVLPVP